VLASQPVIGTDDLVFLIRLRDLSLHPRRFQNDADNAQRLASW
jgi:hypothetical protein